MDSTISAANLNFLKDLAQNNNRDWFNQHKDRYTQAHENMLHFAEALLAEMNKHDHIETVSAKDSLFRIYRDTRFSKDKSPYKTHWAGSFRRATKQRRGGYYYHIEPGGGSHAAGGFFSPNPQDLLRIRQDIDRNYENWYRIMGSEPFAGTFGAMQGETLVNAPLGFSKEHPAINLLKHKQFYFEHYFSDEEVLSKDFLQTLNRSFQTLRPYFDYMSEVLTTDLNGISTI